jgi:hypothetical protein
LQLLGKNRISAKEKMECNDDWAKPPPVESAGELPPPNYKEEVVEQVNVGLVDTSKQLRHMLELKTFECQYLHSTASELRQMLQIKTQECQNWESQHYSMYTVLEERNQFLTTQITQERNQLREECNQLRELTKEQELKRQKDKLKLKQLQALVKNEKDIYVWKAKAEMATCERDKLRCLMQTVTQTILNINDENNAGKWELCVTRLKAIVDPPQTKRPMQALAIEDADTACLFVPAET